MTFTVQHTNDTDIDCETDGETYEVRGHLIGPAHAMEDPGAVTLFLDGLGYDEFFNNDHLSPVGRGTAPGSRSQIEDEPQGLVDGPKLLGSRHPPARRQPIGRDHTQLVAAGVGGVSQPAATRLHLDMAPQAVGRGGDRYHHDQPARTVVQDVDRHHDRRPPERWLMTDRLAQVDVIDLSSPDHARLSHS